MEKINANYVVNYKILLQDNQTIDDIENIMSNYNVTNNFKLTIKHNGPFRVGYVTYIEKNANQAICEIYSDTKDTDVYFNPSKYGIIIKDDIAYLTKLSK